ncbi:hypothetical protein FQN54_004357 [Arachnomyces sp. PD_36]|nr:hypothetical protein FQN54_004357 [Arachnomyces sp. PD_36]
MPVTVQVAKHEARPVPKHLRTVHKSSQDVLKKLAHKNASDIGPILNTALGQQTSLPDAKLKNLSLSIQDHGLVRAAYYAYSDHYNLVLRPEDIWFAILTQFSYYVNAHSEELRSSFVAHDGKKGLIVRDPGQPDMGLMCRNMTNLIDENIADPKLREWILPSFTTTTVNDEVVAAVIMMGTLQKYFDYVFDATCCGIPNVTLLGELSDWQEIQRRLEKLTEYGEEPSRFCSMLRPILQSMITTITKGPDDPEVINFWSRMINRHSGSGMDTLTGWMVAFCFWDEDGKCLAKTGYGNEYFTHHSVEFTQVPAAFVTVPVTYMPPDGGRVINTKLLAGHVGFESTPHVGHKSGNKCLDTLQPLTGWWMYEDAGKKNTGKVRDQFYQEKMENEWNGQASTGYVQPDGTFKVEEGIPKE